MKKQAFDALDTYIYGEPDPKDKEKFDQLTEASSALVDSGETEVYGQDKNYFERCAAVYIDIDEGPPNILAQGVGTAAYEDADEDIRRRGHIRSQHKWKEGMHVMVNDRHAIVLSNKAGDWVHNGSTVCQCGSETGIWTVKNRQGDSVYALKYDDVVYPCYVEGRTLKHYEENTSRKRQCREWSPFSSSSSSSSSSKPVAKRARSNDYDSGEEAELSDF